MNYNETLCEAISIVANGMFQGLKYDRTIVCTVVDDSNKAEGKYTVSSDSMKFEAYGAASAYSVGNTVYVTIPEGDYKQQKLIVGRKLLTADDEYDVQKPFSGLIDITGNLLDDPDTEGHSHFYPEHCKLKANNLKENESDETAAEKSTYYRYNGSQKTIYEYLVPDESKTYKNYTRIGVKIDFKAWLKERQIIEGNYGINLFITYRRKKYETRTEDLEFDEGYYEFLLDSTEMFGNPYNFETFTSQEKVFSILEDDVITGIYVYFYQLPDSFKNKDGDITPVLELYDLFVDNLYICFGYGKEEFTDEKITIFTTDSEYYSRELYDKTDGNKKDITLRWIHLLDKATTEISILDDASDKIDGSYQIRWYKYKYGAPSADEYSGVYWERIYPEVTAQKLFQNEKIYDALINNEANINIIATEYIENFLSYKRVSLNEKEYQDKLNNKEKLFLYNKEAYTYEEVQDEEKYSKSNIYYSYSVTTVTEELLKPVRTTISNFLRNNKKAFLAYFDILFQATAVDSNPGVYNYSLKYPNAAIDNWIAILSMGAREFNISFKPDIEKSVEKIKAIIVYKGNPYRSNELIFSNKNEVANQATLEAITGFYITCDDDTYGNYLIYNEGNYLLDETQAAVTRKWITHFDNKISEDQASQLTEAEEIKWQIPYRDTMIIVPEFDYETESWGALAASTNPKYETSLDGKDLIITYFRTGGDGVNTPYTIITDQRYLIKNYYNQSAINNTVTCTMKRQGITYTTSKELTFGPMGTSGTDCTLVLDIENNKTGISVDVEDWNSVDSCSVRAILYDADNKIITDEELENQNVTISWRWYNLSDDNALLAYTKDEQRKFVCNITYTDTISRSDEENDKFSYVDRQLLLSGLRQHILECTISGWGDYSLTAYLPIPIYRVGLTIEEKKYEPLYMAGPSKVIYLSDGSIDFYKNPYDLQFKNEDAIDEVEYKIVSYDESYSQLSSFKYYTDGSPAQLLTYEEDKGYTLNGNIYSGVVVKKPAGNQQLYVYNEVTHAYEQRDKYVDNGVPYYVTNGLINHAESTLKFKKISVTDLTSDKNTYVIAKTKTIETEEGNVDYTYYIRKASGKPFFRYQYPSYVLVDEVGEIDLDKEQFYIIDYNTSESRNPYLPTIQSGNILRPNPVYVAGVPLYGVQARSKTYFDRVNLTAASYCAGKYYSRNKIFEQVTINSSSLTADKHYYFDGKEYHQNGTAAYNPFREYYQLYGENTAENNTIIDHEQKGFALDTSLAYDSNKEYYSPAVYWTQPILTIQNLYPSPMLNKWNGKLEIDEANGAIMAKMLSAGRKENDNTFTGVVLGDWSDNADKSLSQVGIYGFNRGAINYAFKEDGTAFIGKEGRGRIILDGNTAQIHSEGWKEFSTQNVAGRGLNIDVDDGAIQFINNTFAESSFFTQVYSWPELYPGTTGYRRILEYEYVDHKGLLQGTEELYVPTKYTTYEFEKNSYLEVSKLVTGEECFVYREDEEKGSYYEPITSNTKIDPEEKIYQLVDAWRPNTYYRKSLGSVKVPKERTTDYQEPTGINLTSASTYKDIIDYYYYEDTDYDGKTINAIKFYPEINGQTPVINDKYSFSYGIMTFEESSKTYTYQTSGKISGTIQAKGMQTIKLDTEIKLAANQRFWLVGPPTYEKANFNEVNYTLGTYYFKEGDLFILDDNTHRDAFLRVALYKPDTFYYYAESVPGYIIDSSLTATQDEYFEDDEGKYPIKVFNYEPNRYYYLNEETKVYEIDESETEVEGRNYYEKKDLTYYVKKEEDKIFFAKTTEENPGKLIYGQKLHKDGTVTNSQSVENAAIDGEYFNIGLSFIEITMITKAAQGYEMIEDKPSSDYYPVDVDENTYNEQVFYEWTNNGYELCDDREFNSEKTYYWPYIVYYPIEFKRIASNDIDSYNYVYIKNPLPTKDSCTATYPPVVIISSQIPQTNSSVAGITDNTGIYHPMAKYYMTDGYGMFKNITIDVLQPTFPFSIGASTRPNDGVSRRNFRVNWDGEVFITNGHFSGYLEAESGTLGEMEVLGKLTGGIIEGAEIYAKYLECEYGELSGWILQPGYLMSQDGGIILDAYQNAIIGGTIYADVLSSLDGTTELAGYLTVTDGASVIGLFGFLTENTGQITDVDSKGIGFTCWDANGAYVGAVKATRGNSGLAYRNSYLTLDDTHITLANDKSTGYSINFRNNGDLNIQGSSGTFIVEKETNFKNDVKVSKGDLEVTTGEFKVLAGKSTFGGDVKMESQLEVAGKSTLKETQIDGTLTVESLATLKAGLTVTGLTTLNTGLNVTGALSVTGGMATLGAGLTVNGGATINGGLTANGGLTVSGKCTGVYAVLQ